MSSKDRVDWLPEQASRLGESVFPRTADVHCHCLPGIDDGPSTPEDAIELLSALATDGFTTVVATPHQLGMYEGQNSAGSVREMVSELNRRASEAGVPIEVFPGADVRIDDRLLRLVDEDQVLTVADRRGHLLLELPHEHFLDPAPLFGPLSERGIQTVMTHPERHRYLRRNLSAVERWVDQGVLVQVTAGSLLGDFGEGAFRTAWELVSWGLCHVVATDAHSARRRPPRMGAAIDALRQETPEWAVQRMCFENPWRMLQGEPVAPGPVQEGA